MVGQGKNRENTGNLKMQFEWGPCKEVYFIVSHGLIFVVLQGDGATPVPTPRWQSGDEPVPIIGHAEHRPRLHQTSKLTLLLS